MPLSFDKALKLSRFKEGVTFICNTTFKVRLYGLDDSSFPLGSAVSSSRYHYHKLCLVRNDYCGFEYSMNYTKQSSITRSGIQDVV